MVKWFKTIFKVLVFVGFCVWFSLFLSKKNDLVTADLGRHIQNGKIILHGSSTEKHQVLYTNFYSYTEPDFPFINHHWLSGVLFYLVFELGGFIGVSVFYVMLGVLTFALYLYLAIKRSGWFLAIALALLFTPIMASRTEIRPEIFTYFFSGVFFWVVSEYVRSNYQYKELLPSSSFEKRRRIMWILPALMLFWVNLHIGFIFGIFILGAFGFVELIKLLRKRTNVFWQLFKISIAVALFGLINPFGVRGLLYPFQIFQKYGYMIVENQSIGFLENLGITSTMNFGLYKVVFGMAVLSVVGILVISFLKKKQTTPSPFGGHPSYIKRGEIGWGENIIMLCLGILGFLGIRHFPSFAFAALPILAENFSTLGKELYCGFENSEVRKTLKFAWYPIIIFVILIGIFRGWSQFEYYKSVAGFGLMPGVENSAEFYKKMDIKGPVFNNYDIGGYLIFELFENNLSPALPTLGERVKNEAIFVDNRPEAYSVEFFEKIYKPMQENDEAWEKVDEKYMFNSVFFSHRDYTPWGQLFLQNRIKDKNWAVVYYDQYAIIMLKRNQVNAEIIKTYEISKEVFSAK